MTCQTRHALLRTLVGGVVAFALILQLAILQFNQARRAPGPASTNAQIVATQTAKEICHSDEGGAPSNSVPSCGHCAMCANGFRSDIAAIAPLRIVVALVALQPPPAGPPGWSIETPLPPKPQGWTSSWSSRAPPSFS